MVDFMSVDLHRLPGIYTGGCHVYATLQAEQRLACDEYCESPVSHSSIIIRLVFTDVRRVLCLKSNF